MNGFDAGDAGIRSALAGLRAVPDREAYARAAWSVLTEPGDGVAGSLIAHLGAVDALAASSTPIRPPSAEITDAAWSAARDRWRPRSRPEILATALERARRADVRLVVPGDADWPARLDDLGPHAPFALWVRGDIAASGASSTDWHVAELELAL